MMDPSAQLHPTGQFIRFGLPDGTSLDLEVLRDNSDNLMEGDMMKKQDIVAALI